ncbi:hypothetical protein UFOVP1229_2 [uncultured Caudovirales phage]|uniref:Uncharacterized protein n=1 Tax=uncultured Caudovirales phage TaxID=2100421 RepID=A0A6J5RH30_9CAUD|nr:hypothetical protein UFOVP1229_2 [uncultured Caudovirales phage]
METKIGNRTVLKIRRDEVRAGETFYFDESLVPFVAVDKERHIKENGSICESTASPYTLVFVD